MRVLEIGGYAAGYAGRLFVRAGFEVVRIETEVLPAWASAEAMNSFLHAGKERIRQPASLSDLASTADIVICEGTRAQELLGLGFDQWRTKIKIAITPFGRTGPKADWVATPSILYAMGGYTNLMGDAGRAPLTLPGHYLEFQTGAVAFSTAMAARRSQEAASADIGMLETLMSLSQFTTVMWHCAGEIRSRHGSDFWSVAPSDLYRCKDGWVYCNVVPTFWDPFIALMGLPELIVDPRFETGDSRKLHRQALKEIIAAAMAELTRAELDERAETFRVPMGVVRTLDQVLVEAHLEARDFWETVIAEDGRPVRSPAIPFKIDGHKSSGLHVAELSS